VTRKVYRLNSTFKNSEWVKIDSVWREIPDINQLWRRGNFKAYGTDQRPIAQLKVTL